MARANLNKSFWLVTNTTTASKYIPKRTRICINWYPTFQTQNYLAKVHLNVNIVKQDLLHKNSFWKFYEVRSESGDFNWCWFWSSLVCTLMLWWYIIQIGSSHPVLIELVLRPNRPKSDRTNAPSPSSSLSLVLVELWGTSFLGTIWRNNQSLATAMACFCGCGLNSQEGYG